jgi:conjugal transfer/entry exclusion protein
MVSARPITGPCTTAISVAHRVEHADAQLGVVAQALQAGAQLLAHRGADRVALVRAVEREGGDAGCGVETDRSGAHGHAL